MRFMVVIQPQFPVPLDLAPTLGDSFVAWWDRYRDQWESAGFFAGENGGGGGICNVAGVAEFHQMMQEWPFFPFSHVETHALLDMDTALEQMQALFAARAAMGQEDQSD